MNEIKRWRNMLLLVLATTFSGLLFGGWWVFKNRAPLPAQVVAADGRAITDEKRIQRGQDLFRSSNLMDFGSVLGHGAYLGPDFTAQALKLWTNALRDELAKQGHRKAFAELPREAADAVAAETIRTLKSDGHDASTGVLKLSAPAAAAYVRVREHYRAYFRAGDDAAAMPASLYAKRSDDELDTMGDFLLWTAWLSVTPRPGETVTYTNNWPYAPESGNNLGKDSVVWSAMSVMALLAALAVLFMAKDWLFPESERAHETPRWVLDGAPTPSQRRLGKYFVVSGLLFLVQVLLGGLMAHQYVTGSDFYGFKLDEFLPFQLVRGWHLQLAVLWIAVAWIGLGLFVAPLLSGREPKFQGIGVNVLFGALVALTVAILAGLALSVHDRLGGWWWWLGTQGWEYLELGRVQQVILAVGLTIWLLLIARGLGRAIFANDETGGLSRLFLATTIAIPGFYLFAFAIGRHSHITVADYWRWWIIHLWVEGIFEVFAVVVTGTLLVRMGLLEGAQALRALYLQLILLMGSGVLGTGHHYYWIGAPAAWIGVGATFSALEVVPLTLLMAEALSHYRKSGSEKGGGPYAETFLFLSGAAFWNVVGAGLLGFLINLPAVSYFEHGTFLTATHGHGALMGVYGFLAIGVTLFVMRHLVAEHAWSRRLFRLSFWGMNIGLMGMLVITLLPVGVLQLESVIDNGYDAARSLVFYRNGLPCTLLWWRALPDSIFIFLGVVPLVLGLIRGWLSPVPETVTARPSGPEIE